jgi:formylglycine-generating enzyme required for sulfatase activity
MTATTATTVPHRAPLGRGDLLRVLAAAQDMRPAERGALCGALGYVPGAQPAPPGKQRRLPPVQPPPQPPQPLATGPAVATNDLRAAMFGAAVIDTPAAPASAPRVDPEAWPPITAADWGADPRAGVALPLPPIAPRGRVVPALVRALQITGRGAIDVPRLMPLLTQRKLTFELPHLRTARVAQQRMVVLDFGGALNNFHADLHALARWARQALGGPDDHFRVLADARHPLAGWHTLRAAADPRGGADALRATAWAAPDAGTRIVLVSDLGLTEPARSSIAPAWAQWLQHMQSRGAQVQVWSPMPLRVARAQGAQGKLNAVHWSAAAPLQARPLHSGENHHSPQRQRLAQGILARLAFAPYIDAALVRRMRLALGAPAQDAGLEHLAWSSADLSRGLVSRRMLPAALDRQRSAFAALSAAQRHAVQQVAAAHYGAFSQPLVHMHTLAWAGRAPDLAGAAQNQIDEAVDFAMRVSARPEAAGGMSVLEVAAFLHNWLRQTDAVAFQSRSAVFAELNKALHQLNPQRGDITVPAGMSHEAMADALKTPSAPQPLWLVHDARWASARLVTDKPAAGSGVIPLLPEPLMLDTADVQCTPNAPRRFFSLFTQNVLLGPLQPAGKLLLRTRGREVHVAEVARPRGVQSWWRDERGLHMRGAAFGELALVAGPQQIELLPPLADSADQRLRVSVSEQTSSDERVRFGIDPEFGLWADLNVVGVTQRFRWIAPGEFWMGSPKEEQVRLKVKDWMRWAMAEDLSHHVRITQGFWLADSTCTQAMWLALMVNNPSHFRGDLNLPVERVSYDDVLKYLLRFQQTLPEGLEAELPTEAQWEFACRAGTNTAFSFGDSISIDQVNFSGIGPLSQRGASLGRERTIPVHSLRANAWGLFEMHGNVWEWCADGPRIYEKDYRRNHAISDPRGSFDSDRRVLRGGSWRDPASSVRAAYRSRGPRGGGWDGGGFRLALRSTSVSALGRGASIPGIEFEADFRPDARAGRQTAAQRPKSKP